ncbi:hypothetical protein [Solitalea lacus]|uniref:hypothetical protein n=1 Tax=Solitalea lacus TaxID=2911172 RepID=UPI001EDAA538|nr:hypothetical protein [Solitalea lacus]UKJ08617.1 hypothetical protein L2B55_05480 [Solitalea lacus]
MRYFIFPLTKLTALLAFLILIQYACGNSQVKPGHIVHRVQHAIDNASEVLTFSIADDLYLAIDTVQCGLYKIWQGGFSPSDSIITASGDIFFENYLISSDIKLIDSSGYGYSPIVKFKGYKTEKSNLTLTYEVNENGHNFLIKEQISGELQDSDFKLTRRFLPFNTNSSSHIGIYIPNSSLKKPISIEYHNGILASGVDNLLLPEKNGSWFILSFSK